MGAIHAYQKREDKKQGPYKLYLGQISTKEFAFSTLEYFKNKQELFF